MSFSIIKKYSLFGFALLGMLVLNSCEKDENPTTEEPGENPVEPGPTSFSGEVEWIKTYGGSNIDDAQSVVRTIDGGYAVLGFTQSIDGDVTGNTTPDSDYWLMKISSEGELLWNKVYGGSDDDRGHKIITTNDGGFAVIGFSKSNDQDVSGNSGFHDYWIAKLSAAGNIQWEKSFGFPGSDRGHSVIQTQDGGYFLVGFLDVTASNGQGNDPPGNGKPASPTAKNLHGVGEFWGIKLDASGNKEWSHYYGGTNNDRTFGVLQTDNGDFIMVGHSESDDFDITDPQGSYDVWVVRISNTGELVWQQNFGGSGIEIGYSVTATQDGNFIVVGDTRSTDKDISNPLGNADFWAIKFDGQGNMLWEKTYGGPDFESAHSVVSLENGNLLISGSTKSASMDVSENKGENDFWVLIIDQAGNLKWEQTFGGSEIDVANEAIALNNNKILIVGSTESSDGDIPENQGSKDVFVVKLK